MAFREPSIGRNYEEPAQREGDGYRSWITRGANFAIVYSQGRAGGYLRGENVDEHFVYTTSGRLKVSTPGGDSLVEGESLVIVPPGLISPGARVRYETNPNIRCRPRSSLPEPASPVASRTRT